MTASTNNPENRDNETTEHVEEENKQLLQEIKSFCKKKNYRKHNVLLIGRAGSGKSSVINTMLKLIIGKFIIRAKAGSGNVPSNTLRLGRFPNCASAKEDFGEEDAHSEDASLPKEVFKTIWEHLPDLFDAAAMENKNDDRTKEILRLLIGGYIDPGTNIAQLETLQADKGLGFLPLQFCVPYDQYKMSMIVFACSCVSPIPFDLIKCVREVLEEDDPNTLHKRYDSDVYILITKYDLVVPAESYFRQRISNVFRGEDNGEKGTITPDKFKTFESDLAGAFVIKGLINQCSLHWQSYNDDVGYDNPHIDNCSLKLLKYLTTPLRIEAGARPVPTPLPGPRTLWFRKVKADIWFSLQKLNGQNVQFNLPLIIGAFVCFLAMVIWMMSGTVRKSAL